MEDLYSRTELFIGEKAMKVIKGSKVAVFGLGGVGSYCVEALARAGVGNLVIVDGDSVSVSNLNRQIIATVDTVGKRKAEAEKTRILEINPSASVAAVDEFITCNTDLSFIDDCDYVIDAIDTVSAKLHLIEYCYSKGIKIISAMGAGNKTNPMGFEVTDINKTVICPLSRVIRKELKARGIKKLKVVYSKEEPALKTEGRNENGKNVPASLSFVPGAMGLLLAKEVFFSIIGENDEK